jgi:hypothetical protein
LLVRFCISLIFCLYCCVSRFLKYNLWKSEQSWWTLHKPGGFLEKDSVASKCTEEILFIFVLENPTRILSTQVCVCHSSSHLTFKQPGWYLNCSLWFMKNVLFEQKKIKLWNKQHLVGNETEIMQHVLKMQ